LIKIDQGLTIFAFGRFWSKIVEFYQFWSTLVENFRHWSQVVFVMVYKSKIDFFQTKLTFSDKINQSPPLLTSFEQFMNIFAHILDEELTHFQLTSWSKNG
jgi:hypothetical protein